MDFNSVGVRVLQAFLYGGSNRKKVNSVKFNSFSGDIYDHSTEYEVKVAQEKLEKAKKDYLKAKKEYEKIIKKNTKDKGLSKFV